MFVRIACAVFLAWSICTAGVTEASNHDPVGSIHAAAQNHNVSVAKMLRVAFCESRFDPLANGDNKKSHGLYQLSELPTGLLPHFYSVGYTNPYDAEEVSDYYARVLKGDFLPWGPYPAPLHPHGIVSVERWSCK